MTTKFGLQNHFDIIRTPYTDKEYVLLAEEPKKKWETELPYYDFYRRTDLVLSFQLCCSLIVCACSGGSTARQRS